MSRTNVRQADLLDLAAPEEHAGFRLQGIELFNWGTFHDTVWKLHAGGSTTLLTGDIGSGKSTIVDALTTLLVAPQKISYNKAAGAEARERTVRSYVFGHYKAEKLETGAGARPVSLRDANSYSVLLAHFFNEGYQQHVTLAQVFFMREQEGQPARLCVVADQKLTIADHFAQFRDVIELRRRLRQITKDVHDNFAPYQTAFRKRFGIQNDQALELFSQTVSMKSVGNLTDFVRQHMLQPFPVEVRISKLIGHVDDLTRVHDAVLKAKAQLGRLEPLVADLDRHARAAALVLGDRACRDALQPHFATLRAELLRSAIDQCTLEEERCERERSAADGERHRLFERRDGLKQDIARNGGERLERIRTDLAAKQREQQQRRERASRYDLSAQSAGLFPVSDAHVFAANLRQAESSLSQTETKQGELRRRAIEAGVQLRQHAQERQQLVTEIEALANRRSNISAAHLQLRSALCGVLMIDEEALPFAGELIQVRPKTSPGKARSNGSCAASACPSSSPTSTTRRCRSGSTRRILETASSITG